MPDTFTSALQVLAYLVLVITMRSILILFPFDSVSNAEKSWSGLKSHDKWEMKPGFKPQHDFKCLFITEISSSVDVIMSHYTCSRSMPGNTPTGAKSAETCAAGVPAAFLAPPFNMTLLGGRPLSSALLPTRASTPTSHPFLCLCPFTPASALPRPKLPALESLSPLVFSFGESAAGGRRSAKSEPLPSTGVSPGVVGVGTQ